MLKNHEVVKLYNFWLILNRYQRIENWLLHFQCNIDITNLFIGRWLLSLPKYALC